MIQAVLMDMDGTLFNTEHLSTIAWQKAAEETGFPLDREHILLFRGRASQQNAKQFAGWYDCGEDVYWTLRKIRDRVFEQTIAEHGVPLKPGLFELLETLRSLGLASCIATGTARQPAEERLERSGVLPYIHETVCGDEVVQSKPHPEIFLTAAAKVKTPPERCLVLEDSPNGAEAAFRAGCHLIVIPDETPADETMRAEADFVVPSLREAAALLREGRIAAES